MSTLLFAQDRTPIASDENHVRSTVTVVEDQSTAMQTHAPDFNETQTDADTAGGLTTRQLASHVVPSSRYLPWHQPQAETDYTSVDRQIASSGTAAARESAGQWGHGTMLVTEGIEPTINDGQAFGELYFKGNPRPDNPNGGDYMTPSAPVDEATKARAQATGEANSRAATQASMYAAFLSATTGR